MLALFAAAAIAAAPSPSAPCELNRSGKAWVGGCGHLFDEDPVFTLAPAKAITTGAWRKDSSPREVWAGKLASPGDPDYAVELELYDGGRGVIRTEYGWYAVRGVAVSAQRISFDMERAPLPPNDLDRAILLRADALLRDPARWNRNDDRRCPPNAASLSLYCAVERASVEVTGGFHHRRPAAELVREIVEARSKGRPYHHRLMDYNNDPTTTLADVHSLFVEALARIPAA